jgi:hypothetical protein
VREIIDGIKAKKQIHTKEKLFKIPMLVEKQKRIKKNLNQVQIKNSIPPKALTKESILLDIAGQNFAGKPCHIAKISGGKITFKAHVFH